MNLNKRKEEEQNVLCSLNTLTAFCLRDCVPPGEGHRLFEPQLESCFASCARNFVEMRFVTRDKWMEDYSQTEKENNDIWKSFIR